MRFPRIALMALALTLPALDACSAGGGAGLPSQQGSLGQIAGLLHLPDGTEIRSVSYEIKNPNGFDKTGVVPVDNSTTVSFQIGHMPAGAAYSISLSATTVDGASCSAQPVSFSIVAGQTTSVMLTLRGGGGVVTVGSDAGDLKVGVDVVKVAGAVCPALDGRTVVPLEALVGTTMSLMGYATTSDATFAWTVSPNGAGTFSAANDDATTFTCVLPGTHSVTLTVSGAEGCVPSSADMAVTCTANADSGVDGGLDSGAKEVDAGTTEVDSGTTEIDSGTTEVDSGTAEVDSGTAEVDSGTAEVDSGTTEVDSGTTEVDSGTTEVDSGTTAVDSSMADSGTVAVDSGVADSGSSDTCNECRNTNCRNYMGVDLVHGCFEAVDPEFGADAADPSFIQDCTNVVTCARANGCAYSDSKQAAGCYCGSASIDTCAASGPAADAPCVPQWQAATRTTVNADVQVRFTDLSFPAGWAYFLLDCDRVSCASAGCTTAP